jgi:parvulin-like peptidyl-prolyl isomerase
MSTLQHSLFKRPGRACRVGLLAVALAAAQTTAIAQPAPPPTDPNVLLRSGTIEVTRIDYEAELTRLPEESRAGFGVNPQRVDQLLQNILVQKLLAADARAAGIDKDPLVQRRIALEADRVLTSQMVARIEHEAGREFDAQPNRDRQARERYLVEKARFTAPEQVTVTHILFDTKKRSRDEALREAEAVRARIAAGEDMVALAKALSDDPSAARNGGRLDYFGRERMDPAFSKAAFELKNVGDLSAPVESRFGIHVIRLEGRKEATVQPFEAVRGTLVAEQRKAYVERKRAERVAALANDPNLYVNRDAIDALVVRPDPEAIRKAGEVQPAPKQ